MKEMKTPAEIIYNYLVIDGDRAVIDFAGCQNAMKEYAKMWVALAAAEAGDDSRTVTQNANIIWKMKQEIDAQ